MKRFAPILILVLIAACNDPTAPKKPPKAAWTCADLKPSTTFSWSVDPVLDTLVTVTVQVTYAASRCPTESAWFAWAPRGGAPFWHDRDVWTRLPNGRLETSSVLSKDDWGAHGGTIAVTWGLYQDFDADSLCTEHAAFQCEEYDTLRVRALIGH